MATQFDKKYYDDIWEEQGVHRHDYCENLANELIQKYGKVKILDIGTGCGFLVKTLREKGCDAWGLEISDYAIENSCDPEHVRHGDVRNIPYASGFDLVFSQGMWEYIPEEDIRQAWRECQRVGKLQEHKIDTTQCEYHDNFATWKPQEWWDKKLKIKLNLGCGSDLKEGYTNIDLYYPADIKHDLTIPLPYADNSVDEIYASHIIEHFSRDEWERVKLDWLRVLKSNGILTVACPEFEKCLNKWLTDKSTDYWLKTIYGSQENEGNLHKNGFTKDSLIKELTEVGFYNLKVLDDTAENLEIVCKKS